MKFNNPNIKCLSSAYLGWYLYGYCKFYRGLYCASGLRMSMMKITNMARDLLHVSNFKMPGIDT